MFYFFPIGYLVLLTAVVSRRYNIQNVYCCNATWWLNQAQKSNMSLVLVVVVLSDM